MKKKLFLSGLLLFLIISTNANNLRVTAGQRVDGPGDDNQVKFSIAWDNSWRVVGEPSNYDAVWLFVKYRKCGLNETWKHGLLSTNMADHTIPANLVADNILTADRNGNDTGNEYDFTGHNTGIMVYRSDFNKNNIPTSEITLTINGTGLGDKPFKDGEEYEIRVIGIEMVFVPESTWYPGEDYADFVPEARNAFYKSVAIQPIDSEAQIPAGRYWTNQALLPATFPKGFASFYCMKYEITQGQYRNFLDTSEPITGDGNHPEAFSGQYRNNLKWNTTPDRAQNFLSWTFLKTYLDWACLRPMTELEYEKASVGPIKNRPNGIFAWGTTNIQAAWYVSGTEDGTETVMTTNANCHYRTQFPSWFEWTAGKFPSGSTAITNKYIGIGPNFSVLSSPDCESLTPTYANGTNAAQWVYTCYVPVLMCGTTQTYGFGPLGVGIFARDNTLTREQTGATYYGIMEMCGNVWEQCINTFDGTTAGVPNFTGIWGNGVLSAAGYSDVPEWNTASNFRIIRGGSWDVDNSYVRTFDRNDWRRSDNTAVYSIGGRGVR